MIDKVQVREGDMAFELRRSGDTIHVTKFALLPDGDWHYVSGYATRKDRFNVDKVIEEGALYLEGRNSVCEIDAAADLLLSS